MFTVVASTRRPRGSGTTMACGVDAVFGSTAMDCVSKGRAAEALAVADRRARTGFGTPVSAALLVVRLTVPLPDSSLISIPSLLAAGRVGRADRIRPPAPAYSGGPTSGSSSQYSPPSATTAGTCLTIERAESARSKALDQRQQGGVGAIAVGQNRSAVGRPIDVGPGHTHGGVVPGEAELVAAVVLIGHEVEELQRLEGKEAMSNAGGDRDRLSRTQLAQLDDGMSGWVGKNRPHVHERNERSATHDRPVVELAAMVVQPAKDAGRGRGQVRLNEARARKPGDFLSQRAEERGPPDL